MFIAFTNTKGGVGKSTLACHLAIWLFDRGYRVALLDTDPQGTVTEWMRHAEPKITVRSITDSDAIRAARDELMTKHDILIADAPGEEGEAANAVTLLADLAVLPLQPTKPDVRALKDALKTIQLAHAVTEGKRPETVLVLNCVRKKSARASVLKDQIRELGLRVANCEIRRLDALAESCDSAVTRENTSKSRKAATDIEALFSELFAECLPPKRVANE
jgi:chromosome partitioning protein